MASEPDEVAEEVGRGTASRRGEDGADTVGEETTLQRPPLPRFRRPALAESSEQTDAGVYPKDASFDASRQGDAISDAGEGVPDAAVQVDAASALAPDAGNLRGVTVDAS